MAKKKNKDPELSPYRQHKLRLLQEIIDLGIDPSRTSIHTSHQTLAFDVVDYANYHRLLHKGRKAIRI